VWDEAGSASTTDRSEGTKGLETTQAGHGVTCVVDRDGCQLDCPVQDGWWIIRRDVRRRPRRTEEALASVIADKTYAPTINQIIAAREKGEGGGGDA
jgi:hypothetical protein